MAMHLIRCNMTGSDVLILSVFKLNYTELAFVHSTCKRSACFCVSACAMVEAECSMLNTRVTSDA